jgi:hypothetical protein
MSSRRVKITPSDKKDKRAQKSTDPAKTKNTKAISSSKSHKSRPESSDEDNSETNSTVSLESLSGDFSDDIAVIEELKNKKKKIIPDSDSDESSGHPESNPKVPKLKKKKSTKSSNEIFKELIKKQISNTPSPWKLNINDMKRICKYIDTSIFDSNKCCIWNGYITNMNNSNKGTYVNFYFRNKKVALHRLLYSNFVAPLDSSEYLKFNCDNKGICCNINHYEKYKYSKNNTGSQNKKETKTKESKKDVREISIICDDDPDQLTIDFD